MARTRLEHLRRGRTWPARRIRPYAEDELYVDRVIPGCPPFGGSMIQVDGLPVHDDGSPEASEIADLIATKLGGRSRGRITGMPAIRVLRGAVPGDYAIVSAGASVELWGADDRGLRLAGWRLLRDLGYRALAPTTEWTIAATGSSLVPCGTVTLKFRWFLGLGEGCGVVGTQQARATDWQEASGLISDGVWDAGTHRWATYVSQGAPEAGWVSSAGSKLHAELPELVADYALWAQGYAVGRRCVSVGAPDNPTGWGEIPISPSECEARLANGLVAAGVTPAVLAYGDKSSPPSTPLEPSALVVVASAYMQDGLTEEQVYQGWLAAGGRRWGLYAYPHVWTFAAKDLPGMQRSGQRAEVELELSRMARSGTEGWRGDAGPAWVQSGRWYYAIAAAGRGDDALAAWDEYPALVFPTCPVERAAWFGELAVRVEPVGYSSERSETVQALALALLDAPISGAERVRALDCARYAWGQELWRRYWWGGQTVAGLDAYMRWAARCRERDAMSYRCAYFDSVLAADRDGVADLYGLGSLTPSSLPWPDSNSEPTESEVRTLFASG